MATERRGRRTAEGWRTQERLQGKGPCPQARKDSQAGSWWRHLSIVTGSGGHVGLSGTSGRRGPWRQEGEIQPRVMRGLVNQVTPHPQGLCPWS